MIDANTGATSGIFHDIVTMAAGTIGTEVNWVAETGYGQMPQIWSSESEVRYAARASGSTSDRAKVADFSIHCSMTQLRLRSSADAKRYAITSASTPGRYVHNGMGSLELHRSSEFSKAKTLALPPELGLCAVDSQRSDRKADVVFLPGCRTELPVCASRGHRALTPPSLFASSRSAMLRRVNTS